MVIRETEDIGAKNEDQCKEPPQSMAENLEETERNLLTAKMNKEIENLSTTSRWGT